MGKKNGKQKSGDPRKVSKVSAWKKKQDGTVLELPSGEACRAKRVGMKAFLRAGVVPDYLAATVGKMIEERQSFAPGDLKNLASDPMAVLKTDELMDRALCMTVIEPNVVMPPGCAHQYSDEHQCGKWLNYNDKDIHNHESGLFDHEYVEPQRSNEILYADEVELPDKLFIFNWSVGGGTDLVEFRKQLTELVATADDESGTELPPERLAGANQ